MNALAPTLAPTPRAALHQPAAMLGAADLARLQNSAQAAAQLLKTLGNADRLMLLCQIAQQELCVSELESCTGIRQPSLSQQLGVLRDEGLVQTRREGRQIYYQIAKPEVLAIMEVLYAQFCACDTA